MTDATRPADSGESETPDVEDVADTAATVVERKSARPRRSGSAPKHESDPVGSSGAAAERTSRPSTSPDSSSGSGASQGQSSASLDTADAEVQAIMLKEEGARGRAFSMLSITMSTFLLVSLLWLPGLPLAKAACALAAATIIAVSLWARRGLTQHPDKPLQVLRVYGWVMAFAMPAIEAYLGFLSPIVIVISLGIHYMSMTQDRRTRVPLPAFVGVTWALGATGTSAGLLPDVGISSMGAAQSSSVHFFLILAVSMTLGIAWWTAGRARASLEEAVRSARNAMAQVHNREALLAEAQNQLERAMRLAIGQPGRYSGQVAGGHRLDVLVGFGAMGEVYAAKSLTEGAPSAVKLLRPEALREAKLVERFLREAHICSQLRHPNVVEIREIGQLENGAPFMAMELLEGRDLAAILRRMERLPWPELMGLCRALAGALDHAHAGGIIHRDLKPHNVFQAKEPEGQPAWKVLDFGISKVMTQSGTLTQDGIVGTPGYMSPEQATGAEVDARSDVFAMAALLYRAATGRPAFPGKDTPTIMFDVVFKMPERPSAAHPDVPKLLDDVLLIGLAKAPQDRFPSAGALADAMESIASGRLRSTVRHAARRAHARHSWGATVR